MGNELSEQDVYDLVVIGGGINGAGVARDAAGRGLKVLLCEKDDFGQHTSSASTKLIHGGLRYLENYHFGLVKHSLREREILLRNSPHIIWPLRFVLPYESSLRPRWLIRAGLLIYDWLAPLQRLQKSRQINLTQHEAGTVLRSDIHYGFEYSDCWVQDSRLVILNVVAAANAGARVLSRTRCTDLKRENNYWWITLAGQSERSMLSAVCRVRARAVVNTTGAWVDSIAHDFHRSNGEQPVQLVRGSHIVVNQLFDHRFAYIFQNTDRRVVFCIPYERRYTLIGTTEISEGEPDDNCTITRSEIDYLCQAVNRYLKTPVGYDDVVWSYSGIRTLCGDNTKDASQLSRDYTLKYDDSLAPIVSVFGGKITTYRRLAEDVLDQLGSLKGFNKPKWTYAGMLPGGDIGEDSVENFSQSLVQQYRWMPPELAQRYACHYGTNAHVIAKDCTKIGDLGEEFSPDLYQAEVDYLIQHEFVRSAEDVIWRRTRLGIGMNSAQIARLNEYIDKVLDLEDTTEVAFDASLHTQH